MISTISDWCPKGRKAEEGVIPVEYHLTEMLTPAYLPKTQANVIGYDEYVAKPPLACILAVAGSQGSHAPGMQEAVFRLMVDMLIKVSITSKHFIRPGEAKRVRG